MTTELHISKCMCSISVITAIDTGDDYKILSCAIGEKITFDNVNGEYRLYNNDSPRALGCYYSADFDNVEIEGDIEGIEEGGVA